MPFAYEQALDDWRATCACAQRQSLPTHRLAADAQYRSASRPQQGAGALPGAGGQLMPADDRNARRGVCVCFFAVSSPEGHATAFYRRLIERRLPRKGLDAAPSRSLPRYTAACWSRQGRGRTVAQRGRVRQGCRGGCTIAQGRQDLCRGYAQARQLARFQDGQERHGLSVASFKCERTHQIGRNRPKRETNTTTRRNT